MPPPSVVPTDPLVLLARLPEVTEAVQDSRRACDDLRWHAALRRRADQARVEAVVRAAAASAAIEGARLPVDLVRDTVRGARELPADAAGRVVRGAVRVAMAGEEAASTAWQRSPAQLIARLHTAVATGWLDADELGRPRGVGVPTRDLPGFGGAPHGAELADRLAGLAGLLAPSTSGPDAPPALVVAAVVHAELMVIRPFTAGNGLVARALARVVTVERGLDPTGVAVPEVFWRDDPAAYATGLRGYATGGPAGVARWIRSCADALVRGAQEGERIAESILGGRPTD